MSLADKIGKIHLDLVSSYKKFTEEDMSDKKQKSKHDSDSDSDELGSVIEDLKSSKPKPKKAAKKAVKSPTKKENLVKIAYWGLMDKGKPVAKKTLSTCKVEKLLEVVCDKLKLDIFDSDTLMKLIEDAEKRDKEKSGTKTPTKKPKKASKNDSESEDSDSGDDGDSEDEPDSKKEASAKPKQKEQQNGVHPELDVEVEINRDTGEVQPVLVELREESGKVHKLVIAFKAKK